MLGKSNLRKFLSIIRHYKTGIYFVLIVLSSFFFRSYNLFWDNGYSFHPDERAIVLFTIPLSFPKNIGEFLLPQSPLNPHFFAYGNFPLYLLRISAEIVARFNPAYLQYGNMQIVGRYISVIADTFSVVLIFLVGKKIFSSKVGLFAAFFYATSVLPIQLSHFYAVDTLLTFFMLATFYFLICFVQKPTAKLSLIMGMCMGLSLATKISSLPIFITILFSLLLILFLSDKGDKGKALKIIFFNLVYIVMAAAFVFVATQPYTLIDNREFINQTLQQSQMTKSPFAFPYTLQYVGKIHYFYEFKNILLWGQGAIITLLSICGIFALLKLLFEKRDNSKNKYVAILLFHFFLYFGIIGSFAVGWMRYLLPLYPFLSLFAAFFFVNQIIPLLVTHFSFFKQSIHLQKILLILFCFMVLLWPISFLSIYQKENTRITASKWINENIPTGSRIAIEHWDDALPVFGGSNYSQIVLPLYDPDTEEKWRNINLALKKTDYIIIASNRLYVPLQKLTDCKKLPAGRCYPLTANYYKSLFSGELGFKKVAEFINYPTVPFTTVRINDQSADESFTVSDHPKVMIFKRIEL